MSVALANLPRQPIPIHIVMKAKAGCPDSQELVFNKCRIMVYSISQGYFTPNSDRNDMIQEGYLGLLKAIRDFEPGRNAAFENFARVCITRHFSSLITNTCRKKRKPELQTFSIDANEYFDAPDTSPSAESILIRQEDEREFNEFLEERLSILERQVVILRMKGCSYEEVANRLNVPTKSIDNAYQRVRHKFIKLKDEASLLA